MAQDTVHRTIMICRECNHVGEVLLARDYVLMTNRKIVLNVAADFIKVGNDVYCGDCLQAVHPYILDSRSYRESRSAPTWDAFTQPEEGI